MCSVYVYEYMLVCHKFVFNIFALFTDAQNALSGDNSSAAVCWKTNYDPTDKKRENQQQQQLKKKFPSFRHPPNACALQLDSQYITAAKLPSCHTHHVCSRVLCTCPRVFEYDISTCRFLFHEASKCLAYDGMEYMRYDIVRLLRCCYAMYWSTTCLPCPVCVNTLV